EAFRRDLQHAVDLDGRTAESGRTLGGRGLRTAAALLLLGPGFAVPRPRAGLAVALAAALAAAAAALALGIGRGGSAPFLRAAAFARDRTAAGHAAERRRGLFPSALRGA